MSVLIKGMQMPKRCEDCFCYRHNAEYDYAYCCISSVNVLGHGNARLNNCPLVEVPILHGKLIDADALIEFIENRYEITWESDCYEGGIKDACCDILEKIDAMPTTIDAEE